MKCASTDSIKHHQRVRERGSGGLCSLCPCQQPIKMYGNQRKVDPSASRGCMRRILPTLALVVFFPCVLTLTAFGQAPKEPSAASTAPKTQSAPAAGPGYVIAPGDLLEIQVWKEPEI